MKENILILILLFFMFSCKNENENKTLNTTLSENQYDTTNGRYFFNFDEIEYYSVNIVVDENVDDIGKIYRNKDKSNLDNLRYKIILGDFPNNLKNQNFNNQLTSVGFKKSMISNNINNEIKEIFSEKKAKNPIASSCLPIYRDILVFKKSNKTVGVAKICFECLKNKIIGTKANTEDFGQDGDYEKLEKLIKK